IGRHTLRNLIKRNITNIDVVDINDLTSTSTLAHLFKYDSVHGPFEGQVTHDEDYIYIDGHQILVTQQKNPTDLPWEELAIDVVIESTGFFTSKEKASLHIEAGAKQVIISAPSPD